MQRHGSGHTGCGKARLRVYRTSRVAKVAEGFHNPSMSAVSKSGRRGACAAGAAKTAASQAAEGPSVHVATARSASADGALSAPRAGSAPSAAQPARIHDIFVRRLADLEGRVERELERPIPASGPTQELLLDVARELWRLGSDFVGVAADPVSRRAGVAALFATGAIDDFGIDASLAETVREIVRPLARRWLGVRERRGVTIPERGGVLILLNRSAWPLPLEALVLWSFVCDGRVGARPTLALWDDDLPELPYFSDFLRRIGIVAASSDNCRQLLERGAVLLAYPEGRAAASKTYDRRYRMARFAHKELIGAALAASAAIVPAALVGSEESYPVLGFVRAIPVTPQFPLLGLFGLLPLPLAWSFRLGAPVEYAAGQRERPDIDAIADAVRSRIQAMLGELLAERRSIVGG